MVRQLTAIMFTDMVGYTALMQEDEQQARANRDRQRDVLERAVTSYGGRILQFYGDGTLSVFQSAVSAVECAIRIQKELREGDPEIPLRIGIHTGDVVHDDNGVFGDGVNVASRIEGLGIPGSVLISGKVYDEIKNQPDIRSRPLGSFNLKNIKHPTRVYAIANEGLSIPSEATVGPDRVASTRSIAVLPFVNMSSDAENEFFSDGITEEIINALTRVNGLQVTARTSSFAFKGHRDDIRDIAGRLGVTHVLEGSVRKAGERVRVTAQLICAANGYHLMSEAYDGALDDIFALQDEISQKIVAHLAERLSPVPVRESTPVDSRLVHAHSHDSVAYQEYLRGRFAFARWSPDSSTEALEHFERSIELDPDCALPWAGLTKAYLFLGATGHMRPEEAFPPAERAALKALELEESAGEVHAAMGMVQLLYHRDWPGAYRSFQKALTLTPGSADTHHFYSGYLRTLGEFDESVRESQLALQLDPLSLPIRLGYAEALLAAGEFDEAATVLSAVLADDPTFRAATETLGWVRYAGGDPEGALALFEQLPPLAGHRYAGAAPRGFILAKMGRHDDARAMLDLIEERAVESPHVSLAMDRALIHLGLEDMDQVFHWLDLAVEQMSGGIVFLAVTPFWQSWELKSDPRAIALLDRIGYPQEGRVEAA